jgi:RNA 2',3'-cyclic 3'-phosphodiesterase
MPRLFIAVDLPEPTRQALASLCAGLTGARWVGADQMHLTLRFLGQVSDERVASLREQLTGVSGAAFRIGVHSVGVFPPLPSRRKPARVLWAGVTPPAPLVGLKNGIDDVLGPDPEAAGRGFSPHVTLARFKEPPAPAALSRFLEEHRSFRLDPFAVDTFSLYESRTQPGGAVYTALARYPLHVH